MKQPRKVALVNVADYPRGKYSAYWVIGIEGDDEEGYRWQVNLHSYEPVGWSWQDKVTPERPDVAWPAYPPDIAVRQEKYLTMTSAQQAQVRAAQDARRAKCAEIYEAHPKPVCDLDETMGVTGTRDEADTAAQKWVIKQMKQYHRPATPTNKQKGFALAAGPIGMFADIAGELVRLVIDGLARLLTRPILMALGYSTTIRNNRMVQVRDAIDAGAGAGFARIYDGSRPATCGTATTLLAELTHSDPCAGAPSGGVLTFSAITTDTSANATGTATWFRDVDSTGTCCVDGSVGTAGSDLNLNSTSIAVGQQVSVTSKTYTAGNA